MIIIPMYCMPSSVVKLHGRGRGVAGVKGVAVLSRLLQ